MMKVNVEMRVCDAESHKGTITFVGDLSGDLEKQVQDFNTVEIRTWLGLRVSKIKED